MDFLPSSDTAIHESYYELNEADAIGSHNAKDAPPRTITELNIKDDASSTITGARFSAKANQRGHEYSYIILLRGGLYADTGR